MLIRLRSLIPTEAKLQLFKAAILPYLTYCHLIWHFCKSSDSRRLERAQERGLRAVYKDKHSTYERLLQKAELTTLLNRRLQDICILMYKVKHNLSALNICNIFQGHNSSYNLRQSDFSVPRYNTVTYGKHLLRYLILTLWSKLATADRSVTSLASFKNRERKCDLSSLLDDGCRAVLIVILN